MRNDHTIQRFEHQFLEIDEVFFRRNHWEALGWYNSKHGSNFFTLLPKGVKFNQYVGVIQVGDLTIEVLPKIGQVTEDENKSVWQSVLIEMLRQCNWMNVYAHEKSALHFKPNSVLEAYLEIFIGECEKIVRQGLVKKYRTIEGNSPALKGKMLFSQQIQKNSIHKERFYTRHQTFDQENTYNRILYKALNLVPALSKSPFLKDRVSGLLLCFPDLDDINVSVSLFDNLVFDRKTLGYKEAIDIAAMLLLNYRPDIVSGSNHVLAILFDMNDLWEEYIFRQLYRHRSGDLQINPQRQKTFWRSKETGFTKTIKPDIVIHEKSSDSTIIIDTKWKLPDKNQPPRTNRLAERHITSARRLSQTRHRW